MGSDNDDTHYNDNEDNGDEDDQKKGVLNHKDDDGLTHIHGCLERSVESVGAKRLMMIHIIMTMMTMIMMMKMILMMMKMIMMMD